MRNIIFRFAVALVILPSWISSQSAGAASIGVNFATDASGATSDLGLTDTVGVVPQENWNNAHNTDASLPNLVDDQGNPTGASMTWTHSPLSSNVPSGTPIGNLLHSGINAAEEHAVVVSNIPYASFDLYIYIATSEVGNQVMSFKIDEPSNPADQLVLLGLPDTSGSSTLTQASPSAAGSYLFLANVSGSTLYIDGTSGSVVDGFQLVATPEPAGIAIAAAAAISWTLFVLGSNLLARRHTAPTPRQLAAR